MDEMELANPADVRLQGTWHIDAETNFLHAFGSVENHSRGTISGQVRFVYTTADGSTVQFEGWEETTEYDTVGFSQPIAPGGTGYYHRVRDLAKLSARPVEVVTSLGYAVLESVAPNIEIVDLAWRMDTDGLRISGRVRNRGPIACLFPSLAVAFWKDGRVVAVDSSATFDVADDALQAGHEYAFDFIEYSAADVAAYDDVRVAIDCGSTTFPR